MIVMLNGLVYGLFYGLFLFLLIAAAVSGFSVLVTRDTESSTTKR